MVATSMHFVYLRPNLQGNIAGRRFIVRLNALSVRLGRELVNRNYRRAGLVVALFIVAGTLSSLLNTGCDPCASCSNETGAKKTPTRTPTPKPTQGQTPSGQGLIGIDPLTNVGYVPIYSLSGAAVRR